MLIIRGTFVHTPELGTLEVLHNHLAVIDDAGQISHLASADAPESFEFLNSVMDNKNGTLVDVPHGSFILPTFCDLHLHAPQFLYQGTGLDLPLSEWLERFAVKAEVRLDENAELARRVYTRLAARLKENGTGAVVLFGTIKEETNVILAECMQAAGLRAFVGKLSADVGAKASIEPSAAEAIHSARGFVTRCRERQAQLDPSQRLVEPVLTARFVSTCSDELLDGLGRLSEDLDVKMQSHMWARGITREMEDIDVFEKNNLLTERTIHAHCTFLSDAALSRVAEREAAIAHCPLSNAYFSASQLALREALDRGARVGLGTDIAGGYSADIMNAMRQAVAVSRMRESSVPGADSGKGVHDRKRPVDWKEALYLATRGGALCLGGGRDHVGRFAGMFRVGAPFDAQQICLYDPASGRGCGALDYFDLENDNTEGQHPNSAHWIEGQQLAYQDLIEKWWCVGDTRNRMAVWVQGNRIWEVPSFTVSELLDEGVANP